MSALLKIFSGKIFLLALCGIFLSGEKIFAQSEFSGERLKSAVLDYARQEIGDDTEIFLSQNIQDQKFSQSGITAQLTGDAESIKTLKIVGLEFVRGTQLVKRMEIPVRIKQFAQLVKAVRTISPGEILSEKDFIVVKADVSQFNQEEILSVNELIGKSLRRQIAKGYVIPRSAVIESSGVKRGEAIAIVVQSGSVAIKTSGKALEDGNPGEMIRVSREGAFGNLTGKILDDGTVLITP